MVLWTMALALLVLMMAQLVLMAKPLKKNNLCFCTCSGDEDMKIMPQDGLPQQDDDSAEDSAEEYVREKDNGNMARAHRLGEVFAGEVLREKGVYTLGLSETESLLMLKHRRILFAFVVDRTLDECSPNSLLAQAALNVFYDAIQKEAPEFYREMNASGAFSLYLLSARGENPAVHVGEDFAELCQVPDQPQIAQMAEHLYDYFVGFCRDALERIGYVS
ncbi:MAG: hypothetical protein ACLRVT_08545 [Oscillospiraceae bacterium]